MAPVDKTLSSHAAAIRGLAARVQQYGVFGTAIQQIAAWLTGQPPSITDEIDRIPGRRIEFRFSGTVDFTTKDLGTRGKPVTLQVSQDGPFVMTHYPMVLWRPSSPVNATNLGRWRPVSTFPLPDQVVDEDIIDLAYEVVDGGSNRNFQSAASGPIFSRPDNLIPLPVPTLWATSATLQFYPTYNAITWNGSTPPDAGTLQVDFIGYRIVNL